MKIRNWQQYLRNVQSDGYDLSVLEKTVHKPVSQINKELLAFVKTDLLCRGISL